MKIDKKYMVWIIAAIIIVVALVIWLNHRKKQQRLNLANNAGAATGSSYYNTDTTGDVEDEWEWYEYLFPPNYIINWF